MRCSKPMERIPKKREMRQILLEMYEKLWEADKDKFAWNAILKETLEKLEMKDTLIDLMNRDKEENGTEND